MDNMQLSTTAVCKTTEEEVLEQKGRPLKEKAIIACILVAIALISLFVLANIASNPDTYTGITSTLDEKKHNVMALVATTTATSAAITALPNDAGTPIAEKLADFSTYFMVILAVIYLEQLLLTTLGFFGFGILIPVACVLFAIAVFRRKGSTAKINLQRLGTKLTAFGLALVLVVPVSVWLTDNVDNSFETRLEESNTAAQEATQQLEESTQGGEQDNAQEDQGLLAGITGAIQDGIGNLTQGVQDALDSLQQQLNTMIDTLAVMIVTSCLIPLLVLIVFLQLVKIITGLDFGGATAIMESARTNLRGRQRGARE